MGQTLSEPVTAKETSICGNANMRVASSCMQGWRINMEDAHVQMLAVPGDKDASFFAVFDGHGENLALFDPDTSHLSGVSPQSIFSRRPRTSLLPTPGARVAQYAGIHLHKKIISDPAYAEGQVEEAIRRGFLATDEDMLNDDSMKEELAGTTAVIVLIKNSKIYCGNVGDSRVIASVKGEVQQLSFDHKPSNEAETKRIIAAGGWVEFNRVNGNLALSRALGDFVFKKNDTKKPEEQIVTAQPDVVVRDLTADHEFLILACDGIWDVLSNQEVVDFVRGRIAQKIEPETICEELMMRCLAPDCQMGGLGCDNMTVVLVCFLHANTYENLANMCSRPCSHAHLMPTSQQSDTEGESMESSLE